MKRLLTLLIISCVFIFTGCATLFSSQRQHVLIKTEPPGATVFINDSAYGLTPMNMNMKRKTKSRTIRLKLDGYKPKEVYTMRTLNGWFFGNIFFGGVIGMTIDALTGSMYNVTPAVFSEELVKE